MGVASSMNLNQDDPYAATNRRISIVVLNHRAQAEIESSNAANPANAGVKSARARQATNGQSPANLSGTPL